jgi:hypothetical protein
VDLEALRTHLSQLKVVVGEADPDVQSLARRIQEEEKRRTAAQAAEDAAHAAAAKKAEPPSVLNAQRKHRILQDKRDRCQKRVEKRRKALDAAKAELETEMAILVELEERVLVAEADVRTAVHRLEAELDGKVLSHAAAPEVSVVTSTLESQMVTLLRTMSVSAEAMLSSSSKDPVAILQQVATWATEIGKLPLQAKFPVKQEHEEHAAGNTKGAATPPAKKARRHVKSGRTSTDEEQALHSTGSAVETDMRSAGSEGEEESDRDKEKEQESGRKQPRERSRSPLH